MTIDKNILRTPRFWCVVIPAVLFIMALHATMAMYAQKAAARVQLAETETAFRNARMIAAILQKSGKNNTALAQNRNFDSIASARRCARAAQIPESKLSHGETSRPKVEKDGSVHITENFNLRNVKLIQIATMIDYAEQNYNSLRCSQITINNSRTRRKDNWDADMTFQYVKKKASL